MRYHNVAHAFTAKKFIVFAMDHIGHGRSDRAAGSCPAGFLPDYHILIRDLLALCAHIRTLHPSLPLSLLAHSMGTLVTINALPQLMAAPHLRISSVVFSGAALYQGPSSASPFGIRLLYPLSQSSSAVTIAGIIAWIDPKGPGAPLDFAALTNNKEVLENLFRDPYQITAPILNKTAFEFLKMCDEAKKRVASINIPFLCMHGEDDDICLSRSSVVIFENAGTLTELL